MAEVGIKCSWGFFPSWTILWFCEIPFPISHQFNGITASFPCLFSPLLHSLQPKPGCWWQIPICCALNYHLHINYHSVFFEGPCFNAPSGQCHPLILLHLWNHPSYSFLNTPDKAYHKEQKPNEGHSLAEHTWPLLHVINSTEPVQLPVIKPLTPTLIFLQTFDYLEFKEERL